MTDRRIIVTGAAGFVGSHLSIELASRGYQVVATDLRMLTDDMTGRFRQAGVTVFLRGDLGERGFVEELLAEGGGVIHAAGASRVSTVKENPPSAVASIVTSTTLLLEQATRDQVPWFILLSTREIERLEAGEMHNPAADDFYALLKQLAERISRGYCDAIGRPLLVFRLSDVYGSLQDHQGKLLSLFLRRALADETLQIHHPEGECFFTHINDVVAAICQGVDELQRGREGFELRRLWSDTAITIRELSRLILKVTGSRSQLIDHHQQESVAVNSSWQGASSDWRFSPAVEFHVGLKQLSSEMKSVVDDEG